MFRRTVPESRAAAPPIAGLEPVMTVPFATVRSAAGGSYGSAAL